MRLFTKKFKELLAASPEYAQLQERVERLEMQVVVLAKALGDAQRACSDVAKATIENRKSLTEVMSYLTAPEDDLDPTSDMGPAELAEYKRNLN